MLRKKSSSSILLPDVPDSKSNPHITKKKYKETITIHPDSLRNVKESIKSELEKYRNKWREIYKGVLIDIRYVELEQSLGEIHDEYPYIHCEVNYGARIFRPVKGAQINGSISQIFSSHIGLLVYGLYNATIPAEEFGNTYYVDNEDIYERKTKRQLEIGDEITFEVDHVKPEPDGFFTIFGTVKK